MIQNLKKKQELKLTVPHNSRKLRGSKKPLVKTQCSKKLRSWVALWKIGEKE